MFKRLWHFFLLVNGVSTPEDADQERGKWDRFRAEHDAWERRQREDEAGDAPGADGGADATPPAGPPRSG